MQVAEKVITGVRERHSEIPYSRRDYIDTVLYDNDPLVQEIWVLIDNFADEKYEVVQPSAANILGPLQHR